jgi:hypothetical protein
MKLPTLYSRTSKGAIQEWTVEVDDNLSVYRTYHGQVNGKIQTSNWFTCEATNTGRANERNGHEQAIFESTALWKKKKEAGAFEDISEIDTVLFIEPMLAKNWDDRKSLVRFPVCSQPKLDGCLHRDSKIALENSEVTISELYMMYLNTSNLNLPKIQTYNEKDGKTELKRIKNVILNGVDIKDKNPSWYRITTDSGEALILTGNHRVWVNNLKCWRRVDELDGTEILKKAI